MDNGDPMILDSLAHVTNDGVWFHTNYDASLSRLLSEMKSDGAYKACVVSIHGFNMPNEFVLRICRERPQQLIPIAGINTNIFSSLCQAKAELDRLKENGFKAIKIHPTLCNIHLDSPSFNWAMEACELLDIPVFICTIMRRRGYVPSMNPLDLLYRTFVRHSGVRVLLIHGGMSEIMSYADLVRALPNALLDLSHTLTKYKGSSLDLDFRYLFTNFDRRCVIGSDFPEYTPSEIRSRIRELAYGLPREKIENICWRNLHFFLNL